MGKQSARMYFNGDHKDIYFRGKYHKAMFVGAECVWYKIEEDFFSFKVSDCMIDTFGNIRTDLQSGKIVLSIGCSKKEDGSRNQLRINWGDDTTETVQDSRTLREHTYPTNDGTEYEVKIYGKIGYFLGTTYYNGMISSCITEILTPLQKTMTMQSGAEYGELPKLNGMFANALSLKTISPNMFVEYRSIYEEIDAHGIFENTSIEYVPELIFSGLYSVNIAGAFMNCKKLKTVAASCLLGADYTTANSLFKGCELLDYIPSTLFIDGFADVENFDECFYECTSLTGVPITLFDQATMGNSFVRAFYMDTNITSEVPPLWERQNAIGTDCYFGCARAENYDEIPVAWQ